MSTTLRDETLNTDLRLFTQSPYPEFDYIVTPKPYPFCANSSLYASIRGTNYGFKQIEVYADDVLAYVEEQIAILMYNNPNCRNIAQIEETLLKIFRWGTENPLDRIAYDTVASSVRLMVSIDNIEDAISSIREKDVWYSDRVMKPDKFWEESWKQYTERIRLGKTKVRSTAKNKEHVAIITEESYMFQQATNGVLPTPQILNQLTNSSVRKIKELTEEDKVWQTKTNMHIQKMTQIREINPKITQKELAGILSTTSRNIRNIEKSLPISK
jgi:hypothetical protein